MKMETKGIEIQGTKLAFIVAARGALAQMKTARSKAGCSSLNGTKKVQRN
jgi:hypothetical protein